MTGSSYIKHCKKYHINFGFIKPCILCWQVVELFFRMHANRIRKSPYFSRFWRVSTFGEACQLGIPNRQGICSSRIGGISAIGFKKRRLLPMFPRGGKLARGSRWVDGKCYWWCWRWLSESPTLVMLMRLFQWRGVSLVDPIAKMFYCSRIGGTRANDTKKERSS